MMVVCVQYRGRLEVRVQRFGPCILATTSRISNHAITALDQYFHMYTGLELVPSGHEKPRNIDTGAYFFFTNKHRSILMRTSKIARTDNPTNT